MKKEYLLENDKISQKIKLLDEGKIIGYINYEVINNQINLNYIFVDPRYRGQGLTTMLMDYLIDFIRMNNYKAIPICTVIKGIIQKPKYSDVL